MQRKHFLSSLLPVAFTLTSAKFRTDIFDFSRPNHVKIPPYLQAGDTIGITCPAGFISLEEVQPAIQLMQVWGWKVEVGFKMWYAASVEC